MGIAAAPDADAFVRPSELMLDAANPRFMGERLDEQGEVLDFLIENFDVNELVQSILYSGWIDYEPLIVLRKGNTVLEGNRRLAALRALADRALRKRMDIRLPARPGPEALPRAIRARYVESRDEARDYIGFKHISGPFKWDPLAKAKYASEWLGDAGDMTAIGRRLGDTHSTMVRLVNGWRVLNQACRAGFDRSETTRKSFYLSHLYTALAAPSIRDYLDLPRSNGADALPESPVPAHRIENLRRLMSWIYGQENEPAVVQTQRPDIGRLVRVLGNERARIVLEDRRDLDAAFKETENKALMFDRALMESMGQVGHVLSLVGNYDGGTEIMSAGDEFRRSALLLHGAMKTARERIREGDAGDADR